MRQIGNHDMSTMGRLSRMLGRLLPPKSRFKIPTGWQLSRAEPFPGSDRYWETRYASGRNSGVGSYGGFAEFKAETINSFVSSCNVTSVIEFGCGDGNRGCCGRSSVECRSLNGWLLRSAG